MKGKPTVRHESKRIDSKRARAAEDAALRGDHTKLVRTTHYEAVEDRQPPILDDAKVGRKKKAKKKPIGYCPKRKALGEGDKRHYYIEREKTHEPSSMWEPYPYTWKECMYCKKTVPLRGFLWWSVRWWR